MLGLDWALLGGFAIYLKFFIPNSQGQLDWSVEMLAWL